MKTYAKFVLRATFVVALLIPALALSADYTGVWQSEGGGVEATLIHQSDGRAVVRLRTFDVRQRPRYLDSEGEILMDDGLGRDAYVGTLTRRVTLLARSSRLSPTVSGGPEPVQRSELAETETVVGTMAIVFTSGREAELDFDFDNSTIHPQAGTLKLFRQIRYVDKVYTIYTMGYPYAVTKEGVTPVKNMTEFTKGAYPLVACAQYEEHIEGGIVPVKCVVAIDNSTPVLYIDPATDELHVYDGSYAFDETKWHKLYDSPMMNDGPYATLRTCADGCYAEVADGVFYIPWSFSTTLMFASYDLVVELVAPRIPRSTFMYIRAYGNP